MFLMGVLCCVACRINNTDRLHDFIRCLMTWGICLLQFVSGLVLHFIMTRLFDLVI